MFVEKSQGKIPFGRRADRWESDIKIYRIK